MKKLLLFAAIIFSLSSFGQHLKKDGTPDKRYKENKETYSTPVYKAPKERKEYNNGGQIYLQKGYQKSNGTYVAPHVKTKADDKDWNNINYQEEEKKDDE